MTPTEKLIADALTANLIIKFTGRMIFEIRRKGSDRPVVVYLKGNDCFDWAFQVPAPKGPTPKTLRTIKAVRAALYL